MSGIEGSDAGSDKERQDALFHWSDEALAGHASSSPVMTATFCLMSSI